MDTRIVGDKYQLIREIGSGGMGAVYEARDLRTGRRVALKTILTEVLGWNEGDSLRRFRREARAGGSVDSQHVVEVIDTGIDSATERPYLVMEFLTGEDLRQLLQRTQTLAPDLVLRVAAQACLGLERAHQSGIVHRDIKPGNLFLARADGGQILVKILDFGIAKVDAEHAGADGGSELTRSGATLGSRLYMSPEQAIGWRHLDGRTDIWSLGVVMYEALCGSTPRGHQPTKENAIAVCSDPALRLSDRQPGVTPELAAVVHKALLFEPSQRFQTAREMLTALQALLPGNAIIDEHMLPLEPSAPTSEGTASAPVGPRREVSTIGGLFTTNARAAGLRSGRTTGRRSALRRTAMAGGVIALLTAAYWESRSAQPDAASRSSEPHAMSAEPPSGARPVDSCQPVPDHAPSLDLAPVAGNDLAPRGLDDRKPKATVVATPKNPVPNRTDRHPAAPAPPVVAAPSSFAPPPAPTVPAAETIGALTIDRQW